jgi:hypothetical protein
LFWVARRTYRHGNGEALAFGLPRIIEEAFQVFQPTTQAVRQIVQSSTLLLRHSSSLSLIEGNEVKQKTLHLNIRTEGFVAIVDLKGFEPLTSSMPLKRSPS